MIKTHRDRHRRIGDRVYRSSPARIQQKFPCVNTRNRHLGAPATPFARKQSTLTQIDFVSSSAQPKRYDVIAISDSEDEHDELEDLEDLEDPKDAGDVDDLDGLEDPRVLDDAAGQKKRRRLANVPRDGLQRQHTLTQMDFLLELGIQAEPEVGGTVGDGAKDDDGLDGSAESLHAQPVAIAAGPMETPKRSKWADIWQVPSSQSPDGTPISISSVRTPRFSNQIHPQTPTPVRTVSKYESPSHAGLLAEQASSPAADAAATELAGAGTGTQSPQIMLHQPDPDREYAIAKRKLFTRPVQQAVPETAAEAEARVSATLPAFIPVGHFDSITQNETQISPATRKRIAQFNSRWAELSRPQHPYFAHLATSPSVSRPNTVAARRSAGGNAQICTVMGADTQLEFAIDDVEESQNIVTPQELVFCRAAASSKHLSHHKVTADGTASPRHTLDQLETLVVLSNQKQEKGWASESPGTRTRTRGETDSSGNYFHDATSTSSPSLVHASQASTVPCTPRSAPLAGQNTATADESQDNDASNVLVENTPEHDRWQIKWLMSDPAEMEQDYDSNRDSVQALPEVETTISQSPARGDRPVGISQLLPSSVFNSDVSLPPEILEYTE